MPRGKCSRHPIDYPCTCAMGHLYRFIEPVLLLMIRERGHAYGYDLSGDLGDYAFTDADIERAALYRTLNILEKNGYVTSHWDTKGSGPARKVYSLDQGRRAPPAAMGGSASQSEQVDVALRTQSGSAEWNTTASPNQAGFGRLLEFKNSRRDRVVRNLTAFAGTQAFCPMTFFSRVHLFTVRGTG